MRSSTIHKLKQLIVAFLAGLIGPITLLLIFSNPALTPVAHAEVNIVVTTLSDELNGGGDCSLREAIRSANTNSPVGGCDGGDPGNDIITFHPISAAGTIVLTQTNVLSDENQSLTGDLDITESVQIVGLGIATTTIDAASLDRVFHILASSGTIEFSDLIIQGGNSAGDGGGIFNAGAATVTLNNVTIQNNEVTGLGEDGGGIANSGGGTVTIINNSVIDNNRVTNTGTLTDSNFANGGGIFNTGNGSTVNITNAAVTNNEAADAGGGVYSFLGATTNITQTLIADNTATDDGGGVYNLDGATTNINQSSITGNTATNDGGGLYNSNGDLDIIGSTISGNTAADGRGGGFFNTLSGIVNVTQQTTILNNEAQTHGGGLYNNGSNSQLTIENSEIVGNNTQTQWGGGLANVRGAVIINTTLISGNTTLGGGGNSDGGGVANLQPGATLTLNNSTIINNEAGDDGGGVSNAISGTMTINTSVISNNIAFDNGGGIFNTDGGSVVNVSQSTIQRNTASGSGGAPTGQGGGIFSDGVANIEISTISGNTAVDGGGVAANFSTAQIDLNGVTIADNEATNQGGGIFRGSNNGGGSITFVNTLIAENIGTNPDCSDQGGASPSPATLTSNGYNLIGNSIGCSGLVSTDLLNADPKLTPLADNGFSTQTHALQVGSQAIDAGNDATCVTTDQRGENRKDQLGVGSNVCDIGAFEFDPVPVPSIAVNSVTVDEADNGSQVMTFQVTLTGPRPFVATVDYETVDGTATVADNDYVGTSGTLIFPINVQTQTFGVTVNNDDIAEIDETFSVNLSNATWATISTGQGQGTIINDDFGFSISDESVTEGDTGVVNAVLDVTLSPPRGDTVTVDYDTVGGTAEEGVDYVATNGTLTFTAGITQQQITVQIIGDEVKNEGNETFQVVLSSPTTGVGLIDGTGVVTIVDNDTGFSIFLPLIVK